MITIFLEFNYCRTVVTVATVKFPLSYCWDSNFEDSSTKSILNELRICVMVIFIIYVHIYSLFQTYKKS